MWITLACKGGVRYSPASDLFTCTKSIHLQTCRSGPGIRSGYGAWRVRRRRKSPRSMAISTASWSATQAVWSEIRLVRPIEMVSAVCTSSRNWMRKGLPDAVRMATWNSMSALQGEVVVTGFVAHAVQSDGGWRGYRPWWRGGRPGAAAVGLDGQADLGQVAVDLVGIGPLGHPALDVRVELGSSWRRPRRACPGAGANLRVPWRSAS